ncbi:unnamed protein product, partial [Tetraodon nigroviridis]
MGACSIWGLTLFLSLTLGWTEAQKRNNTRAVFPCGGDLVKESGFVGSEGFPNIYKPNSKCTWRITVPEGNVVMLSFRIFDMEADSQCRYDYLDVYNGLSNLVQKLDQFCGGKLTKPQGELKTPNWPDKKYPPGTSCSWLITVEPDMVIQVKFDKFLLEADPYCRFDYVAFFNGGEKDDSHLIGKYCGDQAPQPVISSGNVMLVQFVSDLSVTSDGFFAYYTSFRHGTEASTSDREAGSRPVPSTPEVSPSKPVSRPAPAKPPSPPEIVKPDKPTRNWGQPVNSGQGRRVSTPGQDRRVGGTGQDRRVSGTGQDRRVGTTGQDRRVGTTGQDRRVGTTGQGRRVSPTGQDRRVPTGNQNRRPGATGQDRRVSTTNTDRGVITTEQDRKDTTTDQERVVETTEQDKKDTTTDQERKDTTTDQERVVETTDQGKKDTTTDQERVVETTEQDKKDTTTDQDSGVTSTDLGKRDSITEQEPTVSPTDQDRRVPVAGPHGRRPAPVPQNPLCAKDCKRQGSIKNSFCASEFVITGTVTSLANGPRGTLLVSVSIIKTYKAGQMTITQVGESMSVRLVSQCRKCPLLRRGGNYIIMGQVDEEGRGTLEPGSFTAAYKAAHHRLLMNINNQPC